MARSRAAATNKKFERVIRKGYKSIENGVVGGYKKMESGVVYVFSKVTDHFVDLYLTNEDETVEQAKKRLRETQKNRMKM